MFHCNSQRSSTKETKRKEHDRSLRHPYLVRSHSGSSLSEMRKVRASNKWLVEDDRSVADTVRSSKSTRSNSNRSLLSARTGPLLRSPQQTPKGKMLRRPSDSRLMFGGKKEGGDDNISVASSLSTNITLLWSKEKSLKRMETKGEEFLRIIRAEVRLQKKNKKELDLAVAAHMEKAKARLAIQNNKGAVISMKKVKQYAAESERVMQAISFLQAEESGLNCRLNEARTLVALSDDGEGNAFSSFSFSGGNHKINYDLSSFEFVQDKVQNILSGSLSSEVADSSQHDVTDRSMSHQDLLDELMILVANEQQSNANGNKERKPRKAGPSSRLANPTKDKRSNTVCPSSPVKDKKASVARPASPVKDKKSKPKLFAKTMKPRSKSMGMQVEI